MSNFIANARIAVFADTTAFSAALKKVVTQAEKTKIPIKLVPDPVGFIAEARKQITGIEKRLPPVKVKVVPDLTGFAAAVRIAAAEAVKNIKIPVGVAPGQVAAVGGGAGRATGGVGGVVDRRAAQTQLAIAAATDAGVAARRRFDKAISESNRQMLLDQRIATQLSTATEAVTAATKAGIPALLAEAEALQIVAVKADQANTARKARAAAPASKLAAEEAANAAAIQKTLTLERQRAAFVVTSQKTARDASIARVAALQTEIKALLKIDKAETDRIIKQQAATADAAARANQIARSTRTRGLNLIDDRAVKQNEALAISEEAAARSRTQFAAATRHAAVAEIQEEDLGKKLAAAKAAERAATQGLVEAKTAEQAARFAARGAVSKELADTAALRAEELGLAQARLTDASAAATQAQAQLAASGRFGAARRALEATGAQLAGLRGAALSATGAFIATAAGAIAITKAVQSAAQLQSTLNVFKVTAGATADEMGRVSETARQLGRDVNLPGVTAQSAADALLELSKAGLSVQDSIDGARGVLQLATAASIDNQQATLLAASALNAFGLAGDQAVHVADVLANAANASQGSIVDMGVALQQASAVARQAGLTMEQTVGALTIFARAGLRGSDAGTSLRTALIRLINPTAKAQKQIKELGLHLRTATGAINLDVFDEFANKTRNLTAAQRDQALAIIFGQDAIRGAAILAREGAQGLDNQIAQLNKQGTAAALAAAKNAGFAGSLENLKNQITDMGVTIGTVLIPPLKLIVDSTASVIKKVNDTASAFVNATEKAIGFGKGLSGAAADAKNADFGKKDIPTPGAPGLVKRVLDLNIPATDDKTSDLVTKFVRSSIERGLDNARHPPIPFTPPIDLKIGDQRSDLAKGRDQFKKLIDDLEANTTNLQFDVTIRSLQTLSKQLKTGDKDAKKFGGDIDVIIKRLQTRGALPETSREFKFPQFAIPRDFLTGEPGKLAADAIAEKFRSTLTEQQTANGKALSDALFGGFTDLGVNTFTNQVNSLGEKLKVTGIAQFAAAGTAWVKALKQSLNQGLQSLNQLDIKQLDLQIAGASNQALLANARQRKATQAGVVSQTEELQKAGKATLKDVKAQKQILAGIVNEIESITGQIESDAKQKAQDLKTARDKADQAFLDALEAARTPSERRIALAGQTPGENDNVAALVALRKRLLSERQQTEDGLKDAKTKTAQLRKLSDELFQNSLDIQAARQERDAAAVQALTDRGTALQQLGETTGNIGLILKGLDLQITGAKQVLAKARQTKTGVEAARAALAALRETKLNVVPQALVDRGTAIQELGETTGSLSLVLKGLGLQITAAKQILVKAIQAKSGQEAARAALAALKKTRQQMINEARDTLLQQGFDLAEAKGNKSAMLQILDLQIAQSKAEEKQAKTLLDRLIAQTHTAELIQKKKEILNEAIDKAQQGTTVLDLLKQGIETFNASAGNLINANQPFAGPNAFNADIAQFLKFRKQPPAGATGVGPSGLTSGLTTSEALRFGVKPSKEQKSEALTNSLIAALQELTAATLAASGNTSTAGAAGTPVVKGSPWAGKRWFGWSDNARSAQES